MAVWKWRAGLGLAAAALCATGAAASTMTFGDGCERGADIVVAGVGDLLFHNKLQRLALSPGRDYTQFIAKMRPVLDGADIAYGNLEGPTAQGLAAGGQAARDPGRRFDGRVYGYRPPFLAFNFHPSLLGDLKSVGFDVLSTANNHSLDRGGLGVERTIDTLEATGLAFTGTRAAKPAPDHVWAARVAAKGVTVSFIGCTTFTNGWPDPKDQVLKCQSDAFVAEIRREAADAAVDAVIVTPHWGVENMHRPNAEQKAIAQRAVDAGADVVFGAHPHVLQPWEKRVAADGREALIVYSLGNFISNQVQQPQRVGAVALARFTKPETGRARLTGVGYVPTWVVKDGAGVRVTEAGAGSWARGHASGLAPSGNAVSLAAFRDLPRQACATPAPVAAVERPAVAVEAPTAEPSGAALGAALDAAEQ